MRVKYSETTVGCLQKSGEALFCMGLPIENSRKATALVVEISAELGKGAILLLKNQQLYASAALIRQLIECEYLLHRFNQDHSHASDWITLSNEERRSLFNPKQLRKESEGLFRQEEYWNYCELGGHPHPKGESLLHKVSDMSPNSLFTHETLWLDICQHLERLWFHFIDLVNNNGYENIQTIVDSHELQLCALNQWHKCDTLYSRFERLSMNSLETYLDESKNDA